MQSPWPVVDLGSTLDKLSGATQACPVKVSPRLAGLGVLPSGIVCKTLQGVWAGCARSLDRRAVPSSLSLSRGGQNLGWPFRGASGRIPGSWPPSERRYVGLSPCSSLPRSLPRLSDAWIYIEGTPSGVSIRHLPRKDVESIAFFDSSGEPKTWPEIDMWAN